MKYLVQCKYCGALLFKTDDLMVKFMKIEIKCSNTHCKKILRVDRNGEVVIFKMEEKLKPGLTISFEK